MSLGLANKDIHVVKPGIDGTFREMAPNGHKFESPTIVCISRFTRYKGLHYAIRAMKYVIESVPDAQLIIVGNGDDSMIQRELSHVSYSGAVKVVQRVPHGWNEEKRELLSSAHVVLMPSVREGYGIVAIEANACGTSAVGWDVPGLRDSILDGETGMLVPFGDTKMMAKRVVTLLRDDVVRERMASSAVKWARVHSWDKSAEEFGRVIDAL